MVLADKVLNRAFGIDEATINNDEVRSFSEEQGPNPNGYFSRPDFDTTKELQTNVKQIETNV